MDTDLATLPSSSNFSDRIKLLIRDCGSITHIAKTCGFSEGVVRSWRDGRSDPSRQRCLTLARTLGVSLVWLIAGEGGMREPSRTASEPVGAVSTMVLDDNHAHDGMDPQRLTAAMRTLQSALDLAGADGHVLTDHADLLAEYYDLMGQTDPLVRAEKVAALHGRLARRVRSRAAQARV